MANGDSPLTDFVFEHFYMPNNIGNDTIYYSGAQPPQMLIPVLTKVKAEN